MDAITAIKNHRQTVPLSAFVIESNKIEGILRLPTSEEIMAHEVLTSKDVLTIADIVTFVSVCQPDAVLRKTTKIPGVRVGKHVAPPSGPKIVKTLESLLADIHAITINPYNAHVAYETLHPFTDGNGRSGRALWLWHMHQVGKEAQALSLGFLHTFYYQTLANSNR